MNKCIWSILCLLQAVVMVSCTTAKAVELGKQGAPSIMFFSGLNLAFAVPRSDSGTGLQPLVKSWEQVEKYNSGDYFQIRSATWNEEGGWYIFERNLRSKVMPFQVDKKEHQEIGKRIAKYLASQRWGRNYVQLVGDQYVFDGVVVHAYSDLDGNGRAEYWLSYKTMFDQYGGVVLEEAVGSVDTFTRLSGDCPKCGD